MSMLSYRNVRTKKPPRRSGNEKASSQRCSVRLPGAAKGHSKHATTPRHRYVLDALLAVLLMSSSGETAIPPGEDRRVQSIGIRQTSTLVTPFPRVIRGEMPCANLLTEDSMAYRGATPSSSTARLLGCQTSGPRPCFASRRTSTLTPFASTLVLQVSPLRTLR